MYHSRKVNTILCPVNSVMDFIFRRSDGSRISVDTVHPSLLRSSSFSSPRWYHLQRLSSGVFLVSPPTWPNHLSLAFLHLSVMFSMFSLSLMSSFLTWYLSAWQHAHMRIFISVTSSYFMLELVTGTLSIPYSIGGWTIILCIFPFNMWSLVLSYRSHIGRLTPVVPAIHTASYCLFLYSCHHRSAWCFPYIWIRWPVAAGQIASKHFPMAFHSHTHILCLCSWHFHSSLLQGFPPLLQFQLQHVFLPCAQHHIIREHHLPRCFFSYVFRQWIHHDGEHERAESGSLVVANFHCRGFACSCNAAHLIIVSHSCTCPSSVSCTSLTPPYLNGTDTVLPSGLVCFFSDQWIHIITSCLLISVFLHHHWNSRPPYLHYLCTMSSTIFSWL